jgi:hypothetical protein
VLKIDVLRAASESEAQAEGSCGICGTTLEAGPVYIQMSTGVGIDYVCPRCLSGLCEFARSEDLDVAWNHADKVYQDARNRYPEPMVSHEELLAMSAEDQLGVYSGAYLTAAAYWESKDGRGILMGSPGPRL